MKILKALTAIVFAVTLPCLAQAQTSPNWSYQFVPTPAQWNAQWASKQDFLGAPPILTTGGTLTGPLLTAASIATQAGLNIPPGVAPTSPNNGDLWETSSGLFARINGSTVGPFTGPGSFTGTTPIVPSFPGGGVVNYAFDFTVANIFLAQQTNQGATTTSPGWYAQLIGDTTARVRVGLNANDVPSIAFGPGNAVRDVFLERLGTGSLRFGAPDAAAPVAQILGVQNVVAGTSNTAGAALTINGSRGTGSGPGGNIIFQTAPGGGAGSTQNPLSAALTIFNSGGIATLAATDQGAGNLNLAGGLYSNGTGPTGTGGYVRATSPVLVTPALGTPSSGVATNLTGLPISTGLTGAGTGVLAALGNALNASGGLATSAGPTFSGTILGTYTIGGTPTITGAALSGTFSGTPTFSGANFVTLGNLTQSTAGAQFLGVTGAAAANYAPFTLASLTVLASPSATLDLIPCVDHTTGTIKSCTPSALTAAVGSGVTSIAGNSGTFTLGGGITNSINNIQLALNSAVLQASPSNPASTTSATGVMMGLGTTCHLTPTYSTRIEVAFFGYAGQTSAAGNVGITIRYGTGTAPSNGAAATAGTAVGPTTFNNIGAAFTALSFSDGAIITGLTPGTSYWLDLAVTVSAGTGSIANIGCSIKEVL